MKYSVIAGVAIVVLVITIPLFQEALRQPRITLTDRIVSRQTCGLFGTSQTYRFGFTLVNSGDADGFANVQFLLDGTSWANKSYVVPAGSSVDEEGDSVAVGDCIAHFTDIRLESTWKA